MKLCVENIPVKKNILECLINLSDQKQRKQKSKIKRKQSDLNIPYFSKFLFILYW